MLPSVLRRVGGVCSLGPFNLSGSPSVCPLKRSSPPLKSPLALSTRRPLSQPAPGPQGLFCTRPGYLPPKWAPACLAFLTNCYPHPVKNRDQTTDYFFVSGHPNSLRNPSHPSLSSDPAQLTPGWAPPRCTLKNQHFQPLHQPLRSSFAAVGTLTYRHACQNMHDPKLRH